MVNIIINPPDGHGVTFESVNQLLGEKIENINDPVNGPGSQVLSIFRGRQAQGELALAVEMVLQFTFIKYSAGLSQHS